MRRIIRLTSLCMLTGLLACDEPAESTELEPGDPAFIRDPALDIDNISEANQTRSHNMGLNCMRCHQSLGPGLGQFTVAGTIHDPDGEPTSDAFVELRTAPDRQGELVTTIEADAYGNVFTTEPLPLPEQPLFVWLGSRDGQREAQMPFPISSGSCNHCHAGGFIVRLTDPEPPPGNEGPEPGDE